MIVDSKISSKNQISIPVALRRELGVKSGEKITFIKELDKVIVKKKITDVVAFMDGLGKDAWGKDPKSDIRDMRNHGDREVWKI